MGRPHHGRFDGARAAIGAVVAGLAVFALAFLGLQHPASAGDQDATAPASSTSASTASAPADSSDTPAQAASAPSSPVSATAHPSAHPDTGARAAAAVPSASAPSTTASTTASSTSAPDDVQAQGGRTDLTVGTPSPSETVAADAGISAAVDSYLNATAGWTGDECSCAVAVSVALQGDAYATASPTAGGLVAGIAGRSGDAVSVSFSGHGSATADASSGGMGAGVTSPAGQPPAARHSGLATPLSPGAAATGIRALVTALITASGQAAAVTDPLSGASGDDGPGTVSVDIVSTGPLDGCAQLPACAVAIGISVGGSAAANLGPVRTCGGASGAATAVALSGTGTARATAAAGRDGLCAHGGSTPNPVVSAVAGNTGAAYGVSLTPDGPARSSVQSGHLGAVATQADAPVASPEAVAMSGSTGDATGVAIGTDAADSLVQSGDSGDASARCVRCALAAGGSSLARSGDTGAGFALAGAGLEATATATSGDSGDTAANALGVPEPVSGHGATVRGRSGNTGNAFGVAVDLRTWVRVDAHSGRAGGVVSTAKGQTRPSGEHGTATVQPGGTSTTQVTHGPAGQRRADPRSLLAAPGFRVGESAAPGVHHDPTPAQAPPRPDATAADHGLQAVDPAAITAGATPRTTAAEGTTTLVPAAHQSTASRTLTATGFGLVAVPSVLLALAALAAAAFLRRRRRTRH